MYISESECCICSCFASGENFSELERAEQSGWEEEEEEEEEGEEEREGEGEEGEREGAGEKGEEEAKRSKMAKRKVQPTNHVGGRNLTK